MLLKHVPIIRWQYLRAFALLYLFLIIKNLLSALLPFSVHGSIPAAENSNVSTDIENSKGNSATTPIAMAVVDSIGGIPTISAAYVIFVRMLSAMFGCSLFDTLRIRTHSSLGLAMRTASHALGTARCAEINYIEGAYSSLGLMTCEIITSLITPFIFPVILNFLVNSNLGEMLISLRLLAKMPVVRIFPSVYNQSLQQPY